MQALFRLFILLVRGKSKETIKESVLSRQKHFVNLHNHQLSKLWIGITSGMYFIEEENTDPDVAIEKCKSCVEEGKRSRGGKYRVLETVSVKKEVKSNI